MNLITASYDTLLNQASDTADGYFKRAVDSIDNLFGDGYAAKHPELVIALAKIAHEDFCNSCQLEFLQSALFKIEEIAENF